MDTISIRKFLYGIGAVEDLQGEVLIVNGKPIVSELDKNRNPVWTETWDRKLIFLVSAPVQNWKKIKIDRPVANRKEFEAIVFEYAQKEGLDVENGFPFRVKLIVKEIQAHIAYLRPETAQNFSPHGKKADDFPIDLENEPVRIIGFAGKTAGGRFAMPAMPGREASSLHMHFISLDFSRSGHVEDLKIEAIWQLCYRIKTSELLLTRKSYLGKNAI
ncbi:acetolactate decarboxylase [Algoriphagus boritolerans]|uniref:acetolactate decarboxylase n=1 Tax=Algoriphagus boritolerans TaxID=308111 RepID=UPI000AA956B0